MKLFKDGPQLCAPRVLSTHSFSHHCSTNLAFFQFFSWELPQAFKQSVVGESLQTSKIQMRENPMFMTYFPQAGRGICRKQAGGRGIFGFYPLKDFFYLFIFLKIKIPFFFFFFSLLLQSSSVAGTCQDYSEGKAMTPLLHSPIYDPAYRIMVQRGRTTKGCNSRGKCCLFKIKQLTSRLLEKNLQNLHIDQSLISDKYDF